MKRLLAFSLPVVLLFVSVVTPKTSRQTQTASGFNPQIEKIVGEISSASIEVGNVTGFVMKGLSRDDFFFAVQAIDKDGNASVPSFPRPRSN